MGDSNPLHGGPPPSNPAGPPPKADPPKPADIPRKPKQISEEEAEELLKRLRRGEYIGKAAE